MDRPDAPEGGFGRSRLRSSRALAPDLAFTAVAVAFCQSANRIVPAFSPLTCVVLLGAVAANLRLLPRGARPGLGFAGKRLMRLGIALLGLRLALGWRALAITLGVVLLTAPAATRRTSPPRSLW